VVSKKLLHLNGSIADNQTVTLVRRTLAAALLAALLAVLPARAVAADIPADGTLSPDLAKLARPSLRSLSDRALANVLDVAPSGPGSLIREGRRVLVEIRFDGGALGQVDALKRAGAEIVAASRRYQTVTASVLPADLRAVSRVGGVGSVTEVSAPVVHAAGGCEGGSVISEGVEQLNVLSARQDLGYRGAGVTVGVLSDSYDTAAEEAFGPGPIPTDAADDVQSNDIPGPAGTCSGQQMKVNVIEEAPQSIADEVNDEGRAMLQIVHDVAPHAGLAFATAFSGETAFAQNIEKLAKAGAKVIADDVSYFEEPFFQDGPVANAIAKVTGEGVTYLTAAGNENIIAEGHDIASWEAPEFRDALTCPTAVETQLLGKGPHCMDFNPGAGEDNAFGLTVKRESELTVDLQWAEPWSGVAADLDAYLLAGGQIVATAQRDNVGLGKPVELLHWENAKTSSQEVELVINRCAGICNPAANPLAKPRLKFILMGGVTKTQTEVGSEGDVVGPTIYGHAGSDSAIALGAVPAPAVGGNAPEAYSSRGPAKHFFGPVSGKTPAAEIPEETIAKPDVVATDCGATTFFAQFFSGAWRFCGTSAAAPHAAGVAALMVQADPAILPTEVLTDLQSSADPVSGGSAAVGSGRVDAEGALEAAGAPGTDSDGPSTTVPPIEEVNYVVEPEKPKPPVESGPEPIKPTPPESKVPSTAIVVHPPKVAVTHRARARVVFAFSSDQSGVKFMCQFDGSAYKRCRSKVARWFGLGQHVVRVFALAPSGLGDTTPAVFRFKVVRSR
jgi:subtilisin family serine protease